MKRTDNQHKFDALREGFSTFTFERQTVKRENGVLSLAFDFNLDDRYQFHPTLEIPARYVFDWERIPGEQLQALAFQIGMTEMVSYWKIACPKRVVVKPFSLTDSQKAFWKKLYLKLESAFPERSYKSVPKKLSNISRLQPFSIVCCT